MLEQAQAHQAEWISICFSNRHYVSTSRYTLNFLNRVTKSPLILFLTCKCCLGCVSYLSVKINTNKNRGITPYLEIGVQRAQACCRHPHRTRDVFTYHLAVVSGQDNGTCTVYLIQVQTPIFVNLRSYIRGSHCSTIDSPTTMRTTTNNSSFCTQRESDCCGPDIHSAYFFEEQLARTMRGLCPSTIRRCDILDCLDRVCLPLQATEREATKWPTVAWVSYRLVPVLTRLGIMLICFNAQTLRMRMETDNQYDLHCPGLRLDMCMHIDPDKSRYALYIHISIHIHTNIHIHI